MKETGFTYNNGIANFLIAPENRIYRHLLLILCFTIVAVNTSLLTYPDNHSIAFINSFGLLLLYLGIAYLNLYVLIPCYLLRNCCRTYLGVLLLLVILLASAELVAEYHIKKYFHSDFGKFSILGKGYISFNIMTTCFLYAICFAGTSITVLFKHWLTSGHHINKLEKTRIQVELQRLKCQIHPDFLFYTLENAGTLATQAAENTSDILIRLSKLLRYQLYDSTRSEVLLSSEIASLKNLLDLNKKQCNGFTYSIVTNGEINRTLVPPLLFISLILEVISSIKDYSNPFINLSFKVKGKVLEFTCSGTKSDRLKENIAYIKRRLELLFGRNDVLALCENESAQSIYILISDDKQ